MARTDIPGLPFQRKQSELCLADRVDLAGSHPIADRQPRFQHPTVFLIQASHASRLNRRHAVRFQFLANHETAAAWRPDDSANRIFDFQDDSAALGRPRERAASNQNLRVHQPHGVTDVKRIV